MLVNQLLEDSAEKYPDKNAVWVNEKWTTYREVDNAANKIANYLSARGIKRGDKVALLFENSLDYIISYFGILKTGCTVVALNTDTRTDDLVYLLNNSESVAIIANGRFCRHLAPAVTKAPYLREVIANQPDLGPYKEIGHCHTVSLEEVYAGERDTPLEVRCIDLDLAAIVYTSGSTGKPKGVMLSHLNLISNMKSIVKYLHITENDSIMVILPFFYIYGKSLLLTHFLVGGSVVIDNRFVYPNKVLETMVNTKVTGFAGVPSTFNILLDRSVLSETVFDNLRYVTQAGGAMASSVQKRVVEAFAPADLYVMYGATEAAPRLSYLEPCDLERKWGSIGKAVDNVDLFVANEKGEPLPQGEEGEIVARGSNIFQGYWKDPEGTGKVLRHGLYFTGDLGKVDEEGFIYVVGRSKDILKVKGYRVSAKEIEEYLLEIKEIHEVAVIGVPDPILGEGIKAFIVPREGVTLEESTVTKFCKMNLPVYKQPKFVEFMTSLPKNKSGKIMKTELKKLEQERSGEKEYVN